MNLNARAWDLCCRLQEQAELLRVSLHRITDAYVWDFGVAAAGGIDAGLWLARTCLSNLANVGIQATPDLPGTGWSVSVATDHPVRSCLQSQYAGWRILHGEYFAMGSGPMRAVAGVEEMIQTVGTESADCAVGILETGVMPPADVVNEIAQRCGVPTERLCLLVAPTASQAGTVQIVARSVETTLHKMLDLGFDPQRLVSGAGTAPLPPVAKDDVAGIGRTNDAILYGAQVTLWLKGDDESLERIVSRIPSSSSADYGQPFAEIFRRYKYDFYTIDPHLFSPASVCLVNVDSGRSFRAGRIDRDVLAASFNS